MRGSTKEIRHSCGCRRPMSNGLIRRFSYARLLTLCVPMRVSKIFCVVWGCPSLLILFDLMSELAEMMVGMKITPAPPFVGLHGPPYRVRSTGLRQVVTKPGECSFECSPIDGKFSWDRAAFSLLDF